MLPLAGYAGRLSVRPGEAIGFHIANATGLPVAARIVRVVSADPNPAGPGIKTSRIEAAITEYDAPSAQPLDRGSYARVDGGDAFAGLASVTLIATICPTLLADREMAILSLLQPTAGRGYGIAIDARGHLIATIGGGVGFTRQETADPLVAGAWCAVAFSFDAATGTGLLGTFPAPGGRLRAAPRIAEFKAMASAPIGARTLLIGAGGEARDPFRFNGRIERPMLFGRALSLDEIERAIAGAPVDGLVAAWDFSIDMHTQRIFDTGPRGLHGDLVNAPVRAVRGSNWTGREQCFRHAPEQYGAIHFHDDDIDDCRWPATHSWTVPAGTRSGAYALELEAGDHKENIPFFVVPPRGKPAAKIALLISTFTYTVYGNHARPEWTRDPAWRSAWIEQSKAWAAYPHNPGDHADLGLSTYNMHTDGSGISFATWHRPMLNLRIGYVTYPYPEIRGSGLRHFPADTHLIAWLEAKGFDYDVITDWELHHEGIELLRPYAVVMTGSHPEYHTSEMLDALETYRDSGGRLMYLGGNGFYWKIALSLEKPGLIEIRRSEGGIRAWAAEPGEYYNQLDGEYGGLWRRNGRPPQALAGVGFTAQGNFVGSHYRIDDAARGDPRTAWIFSGIGDATIGGFGLSGHGAAGFELDRADKRLGTPAHAIVVARSEDHPPEAPWVLVPEEQLTHITTIPGQTHKQLIRADMTFFETPGNGAVFSVGSITYCGSLPHNGFDNTISRLTENVVRRFLDAGTRFAIP